MMIMIIKNVLFFKYIFKSELYFNKKSMKLNK